jgi:peptidoglycan/xylan/chitin deacetylase (PgdA/CDA1 family)
LTVTKEVEALGLKTVLWTIDSLDWADPIADSITQRVLSQVAAAKKGILLMHDIHKQSVAALPRYPGRAEQAGLHVSDSPTAISLCRRVHR